MPDIDAPVFAAGGAALWEGLAKDGPFKPAEWVLVVEACRIVDRLDKLDALITGDAESWIDIIETRGNPEVAEVVINKPLAEARQQALALKQIFTELRQLRGAGAGDSGGDEVDELAAARAKRIAASTGR